MVNVLTILLQRIAEKLESMKGRAVKVCAKAEIGRKVGHKKRIFVQMFNKAALKEKVLDGSRSFCKIIDVVQRKLCFLTV